MQYIRISLYQRDEGLSASVSLMESTGNRGFPRVLRAPWHHHTTLSPDLEMSDVYDALWDVLRAL